jgi:hypothetical protein
MGYLSVPSYWKIGRQSSMAILFQVRKCFNSPLRSAAITATFGKAVLSLALVALCNTFSNSTSGAGERPVFDLPCCPLGFKRLFFLIHMCHKYLAITEIMSKIRILEHVGGGQLWSWGPGGALPRPMQYTISNAPSLLNRTHCTSE